MNKKEDSVTEILSPNSRGSSPGFFFDSLSVTLVTGQLKMERESSTSDDMTTTRLEHSEVRKKKKIDLRKGLPKS